MQDYSTSQISEKLVIEIKKALESVNSFGSVEIYVQKGVVTQITVRNIRKTVSDGQGRPKVVQK